MIRHVVLLKWNEDIDEVHIAGAKAALDQLPAVIPEIVSFRNGRDLGAVPGNWDYAVSADFVSLADFLIYREHPEHQDVVREFLAGFSQRLAVQFNAD